MDASQLPLPGQVVIHDYRPDVKPVVNDGLKVLQWNVERNYGKQKKKETSHFTSFSFC